MLLLLLLLPGALAQDFEVDLSSLYIKDPRIGVEFTTPVKPVIYTLTTIDGTPFRLCEEPQVSAGFSETYEFRTTSAQDTSCALRVPVFLPTGEYILSMKAVDANGKYTPLYRYEFRTWGLEITMMSPLSNVSPTLPVTAVFMTSRIEPAGRNEPGVRGPVAALCRYDVQVSDWSRTKYTDLRFELDAAPSETHVLAFPQQTEVFVICRENEGAGQEARLRTVLKYDLTPPKISGIQRIPDKVTSLTGTVGLMNIKMSTDDAAACNMTEIPGGTTQPFFDERIGEFSTYITSHDLQLSFDPAVIGPRERNFTYNISCQNLAGHINSTRINVTVNFEHAMSIQVLEPGTMVNRPSFDLVVRPVLVADPARAVDECYVNDDGSKQAGNRMAPATRPDGLGNNVRVFTKAYAYGADGKDDGRKSYAISCYAQEVMRQTHNITLDVLAPLTPHVNASQFICDGTVSARFNSSDAGTGIVMYNYTLRDDLGVIASNTTSMSSVNVTVGRAVRGALVWTISAVDGAQNEGPANTTRMESPVEGMDEQCGLPPFITLKAPGAGYAEEVPYDLVIGTARNAVCRYSFYDDPDWEDLAGRFSPLSGGRTHTKEEFNQQSPKTLYVTCNETGKMHRKQFRVGVDPTEPTISVVAEPNIVVDRTRRVVTMKIRTDDYTFCAITGTPRCRADGEEPDPEDPGAYAKEHIRTCDFRHIEDEEYQEFTYDIECRNLALLESTREHTVVVHLGADFTIDVLAPPPFTSESDITMRIRPSREAVCTWDNNGTETQFTPVNGTMYSRIGILDEGSHSIPVTCLASDKEGSAVVAFTIDKSAPLLQGLDGPDVVCPGIPAEFTYNLTSLDEETLIIYTIRSGNVTEESNTTDAVIMLDTSTMAAGEYTLSAKARNRANATSATVSASFDVESRSSDACELPADHCTNGQLDATETGIDCGGSCDACVTCDIIDDCEDGQTCTQGYCLQNITEDSCANAQLDDGEEAIDCGGSCMACVTCDLDAECGAEKLCNEGYCEPPTTPCQTDAVCGTGRVCQAGVCVAQTGCTDDYECGIGKACSAGVCVSKQSTACVEDLDCGIGKECDGGVCVSKQSSGCTDDYGCGVGMRCSAGRCVSAPSTGCQSDDECGEGACIQGVCAAPEESHLLSIMLIVIGLAMMGGAGYFLYQQHMEKQQPVRSAQASFANPSLQRQTQLSPQMEARYNQDAQARKAALEQEYARRQAEREKRASTFQSFGAPTQQPKSPPPAVTQTRPAQQSEGSDDYVDLSAVKAAKPVQKQGKGKAEEKEGDDAFKELDKL